MASTCSKVVARMVSFRVMRLCHYQSHFPENSIKSLLAPGHFRPSKLPSSPLFARHAAPMVHEQSSGGSHVSAALVRVKELPARQPIVSRAGANSGERFGGRERAFASPFVIFAQLGLVFFDLGFEFAEGLLATAPHGGTGAGGMQGSGWQ